MNDVTTDRKGSADACEVRRVSLAHDRPSEATLFRRGHFERSAKAFAEALGGGVSQVASGTPDGGGNPCGRAEREAVGCGKGRRGCRRGRGSSAGCSYVGGQRDSDCRANKRDGGCLFFRVLAGLEFGLA